MLTEIVTSSTRSPLLFTAGNVTTASFTAPVPQINNPGNVAGLAQGGFISLGGGDGGTTANSVILAFFGAGTNTQTFACNVYGWRRTDGYTTAGLINSLWYPVMLCSFTAITLDSGFPGVVGSDVNASQLFASAITLGTGNSGISVEVVSPGAGVGIAHVVITTKGFMYMQSQLAIASGGVTSMNALWAKI